MAFWTKDVGPEYYFDPQSDISIYELAIIVKVLPHWGDRMVYLEDYLKEQGLTDTSIFRHFKEKKS